MTEILVLVDHAAADRLEGHASSAQQPFGRRTAASLAVDKGVQAEAAAALTGYRVQRSELVMRYARMGMRPDWRAEEPELRPVLA